MVNNSNNASLLKHLNVILGEHVELPIVDYIKSMKQREDFDEFMDNMLDKTSAKHMEAFNAICKILFKTSDRRPMPNVNNLKAQRSVKTEPKDNRAQQKGKKKFSDINSFTEKKKQSKGRVNCDCEGQEHDFMNNCLNCGRIHCIEEGPGPCLFCSEPISFMGVEIGETSKNTKKHNATIMKHRENTVFDDDKDYFKTSPKEAKKNKRKMVIALDFASRKVIESTEEDMKIKDKLHGDIKKHLENVEKLYKKLQKQSTVESSPISNNDLVDLLIQMRHKKPIGVENLGVEDSKAHIIDYGKVCDEDILSQQDHGMCLSMHQPYASLLVAGVKKHEGRSWKTNHRGRLWIAAASKTPEEDEIESLENFYRKYYNDDTLKFPRDYPTSCLLGCVHVEDCLDQESYRKIYPNGESESPYVLICSNPIILPIFYPIVGKHKIYPLDKQLHNCLKLSIRHAEYGMD